MILCFNNFVSGKGNLLLMGKNTHKRCEEGGKGWVDRWNDLGRKEMGRQSKRLVESALVTGLELSSLDHVACLPFALLYFSSLSDDN